MAISPKMLEESFMKDVEELESKLDSISNENEAFRQKLFIYRRSSWNDN